MLKSNVHNARFQPEGMSEHSRCQYLRVLQQLALFMIRAIGEKREDGFYGEKFKFEFTDSQVAATTALQGALQDVTHAGASDGAIDIAAENLHQLVVGVLFSVVEKVDVSLWTSAWRRFIAFGAMASDKRPPKAGEMGIWLSKLRFVMKLVAVHKVYIDWDMQKDDAGAKTIDE